VNRTFTRKKRNSDLGPQEAAMNPQSAKQADCQRYEAMADKCRARTSPAHGGRDP